MKSKFFIIALMVTILLACTPNEPEINEQDRLIGEWEHVDATWAPNTIITDSQIIFNSNLTYDYRLLEPGKLYIKYSKWVLSAEKDSIEYIREDTSRYWFNNDTLTITNVIGYVIQTYPPSYGPAKLRKINVELKK